MPMKVSAPQIPVAQTSSNKATSSRVDENGAVYAKIGGKERIVGQGAVGSWTAGEGRYVIYSGRDGAGGYENEGMSLRAFDTETGKTKKIMAETVMVSEVVSVKSGNKTALIVKMQDGGLGAEHRAVVDPARGQVYRSSMSTLMASGDKVTVKTYSSEAFESDGGIKNAKPTKTETLSLKELLSRPVIVNKDPMREGWGPK